MGIRILSASEAEAPSARAPGNPNPRRYIVEAVRHFPNGMCLVQIRYPDATTFEGRKLLVYPTNFDFAFANGIGSVDPHFSRSAAHPVARFKPDDVGMRMAVWFCENWKEKKSDESDT